MAKAKVLHPDLREFLKLLNSAGVKYLLVGGYAVNYHGYHRATDDLDVWIAVERANAKLISQVVRDFAGFQANQVPARLFLQRNKNVIFGREPVRIDILTGITAVNFAQCYGRRVDAVIDGLSVPIISLDDLRINKAASARNKDLADVENLPAAPAVDVPKTVRSPVPKRRRKK